MQAENANSVSEGEEENEEMNKNTTMRSRSPKSTKFATEEIEDIQKEIQQITKKIEHEKINLRICGEKYEKKFNSYCELQGKPVPSSKDQKEKEKREAKKVRKKHNVADPIPRKKMKDKEIQESQQKTIKEINKNEKEIEALTNEINDIELENQDLKIQIQDLRKQKENIKKQRNQVQESNKEKEQAIENLTKLNDNTEKTVKHRELEKTQVKGQSQKKQFTTSRDDLEAEYHKIIEENIKREREQKKEQAK